MHRTIEPIDDGMERHIRVTADHGATYRERISGI
jgi:hypothetical protein